MTKETDYGIVILACLAKLSANQTLSTKAIAEETGISYRMVCKLLHMLTRQGLLVSHRGIRGGYALKRPAHQISLEEAIAAIEGPLAVTECAQGECTCQIRPSCGLSKPWNHINTAFRHFLANIPLSSMLTPKSLPMFVTAPEKP